MRGTMSEREFSSLTGKLAMAVRYEHAEVAELRRRVEEEQVIRAVAKAVSTAPPLTAEQIDRITAILHAHSAPTRKPAARKPVKATRTTKRKQSA